MPLASFQWSGRPRTSLEAHTLEAIAAGVSTHAGSATSRSVVVAARRGVASIALGIDTEGRKHVLGLREGATETAAVATGPAQTTW